MVIILKRPEKYTTTESIRDIKKQNETFSRNCHMIFATNRANKKKKRDFLFIEYMT